MKYGKKFISELSQKEMEGLLQSIIDSCVEYAGDNYESFARDVTNLLKTKKLVDYGCEPQKSDYKRYIPTGLDESFVGKWGVYDQEAEKLLQHNGIVLSHATYEEAEELCNELNEKECCDYEK